MQSGKEPSAGDSLRLLMWTGLAIATLQVAVLIAAQSYLFGDGSVYLYWLLDARRPITWAFSRQFADLVTEGPVDFAMQSGVADVGVLS